MIKPHCFPERLLFLRVAEGQTNFASLFFIFCVLFLSAVVSVGRAPQVDRNTRRNSLFIARRGYWLSGCQRFMRLWFLKLWVVKCDWSCGERSEALIDLNIRFWWKVGNDVTKTLSLPTDGVSGLIKNSGVNIEECKSSSDGTPNPIAETKTVLEGHFGWNLAFIFSDKGNSFSGGRGSSPHSSVRGRVKVQTAQRDGSKLMIVFNLRSPQRFMTLYDPPLEVTLLRDL